MSGILWPKHRGEPPEVAGFRVQTSVYGLPIPIVFGQARVAGNLIHMPAQSVTKVTEKPSKWAGRVQTGWNYITALALALCEGPITGIGNVWSDKDEKVDFTVYQGLGWSLKTGTSSQAAWAYLTSNFPAQAVPYQFTAYVVHSALSLPNNVLPNLSWEVKGFAQFGGGIVDALPTDVLTSVLTDAQYGAGWDAGLIGDLTDAEDYCAAAGLFVSPVVNALRPLSELFDELAIASNCALVWSDGVLKWIPYGDIPLTGNGHTYTPDTTPIYDLTDDNYLAALGEDPVKVTRKDPLDMYNQVQVEFENRDHDYNLDVATASNDADILSTYLRPAPKLGVSMIKDAEIARAVAQLRQQREQFIPNTYVVKVGWKFSLLEPMDLITLTDDALGLDATPVRVTQVVELADAEGIELTCEDWPFGTASATLYPSQDATGFTPSNNIDPGDTTDPVIFEPPVALLTGPYEIWIAAAGASQYWGGCDVYFSTDDVTFSKVGSIHGSASYGDLTATLATAAALPSVDNVHTLSVDLSDSLGELNSYSSDEFDAYIPLCYVGGEFVLFETASLTSTYNYDLTVLGRGAYGSTIPASHAAGERFALCDANIFKFTFPEGRVGQTVYFKFPAFNIYENALQDVSGVSSIPFTLARSALNPGNAVPQATTSVNPDGSWSISVDGPSWAASYKYATSTSAFPSEATVLASGTIIDGRQVSITSGASALALGETIYATFIPYTLVQANGNLGDSIHARGTYQDFSITKTIYFSGARLTDVDPSAAYVQIVGGYAQGIQDNFTGCDILQIPDGVTLTQIDADLYSAAGGGGLLHTRTTFEFFRTDNTGAVTSLGSVFSQDHAGWETKTLVLAEDTTGNRYKLLLTGAFYAYPGAGGATRYAGFALTYTVPSAANTL